MHERFELPRTWNQRACGRTFAFALGLLGTVTACKDDGSADGIEFRGEQTFLPGLDLDTGWLPDGSPVAVRTTATATGGVTVVALATADGDMLEPVPGSGTLEVAGELSLEVSARIDTAGITYEGVVETFGYAITTESLAFEPFALDAPVSLVSALPAAEVGSVPIPSVPNSTLVLEVTGGELTTAFAGECAEASGGFGQYAGTVTMSGTVACAATVELDVPIAGTQSFGPFAFDLTIDPIETAMDLGTRDLATGEPADAMGPCGGGGNGGATTTDPAGTSGAPDDDDGSTDDGGPSGDPGDGDTADYPDPAESGCGVGYAEISVANAAPNALCAPACIGGACLEAATGSAVPLCSFNPASSNVSCVSEVDCTSGAGPEFCNPVQEVCTLQPTYCGLSCAHDPASCPTGMSCLSGFCTYAE